MPKEKILWALNGLSSVRSSKLREFRIVGQNTFEGYKFRLEGMFNSKESFEFGIFTTKRKAKIFLIGIHEIIEGGK